MKKKLRISFKIALVITAAVLLIYPAITVESGDKLIACRYSDDTSEFETEVSLDERYAYYEELDITWTGFDAKKFGPFYVLLFDIRPGNLIESMYILEESYIEDFLAHADIEIAEKNYHAFKMTRDDVASMIEGKQAIVSNTRYVCPDYDAATTIYYKLHNKETVMYIYETDGLTAIQVGYSDEGPKYIAYE